MSSPGSPHLPIDVAARRGERRIVIAALLTVPFAISQWDLPGAALASIGALVEAAIAYGLHTLGWLGGGSRIVRIVSRADGRWSLCDASGRVVDTDLTAASRISPHALWLRWDADRRPLLLMRGDIPDAELRRLLVRLRVAPFRMRDEHEAAM